MLSKNINNKKRAPKLVFFNEKSWEKLGWFLTLKILALFDISPLHQFSKFNNFLWVWWFLAKNLLFFLYPSLENSTTRIAIVPDKVPRPNWYKHHLFQSSFEISLFDHFLPGWYLWASHLQNDSFPDSNIQPEMYWFHALNNRLQPRSSKLYLLKFGHNNYKKPKANSNQKWQQLRI